jgi:hypothetical protein
MRTRTIKKTLKKQVMKKAKRQIKEIIKEFDNKKELMELFGLVVTQALNIEEFEKEEDFGITGKNIKTIYTKMKNDLGRLYDEIKLRTDDVAKMATIKHYIAINTRAKILKKFDELCKRQKEFEKNIGEKLPTAEELGIPQKWVDFFNNIELVAECMKDYINSEVLTKKEKHYMRRFITYAEKYIKFIENEI